MVLAASERSSIWRAPEAFIVVVFHDEVGDIDIEAGAFEFEGFHADLLLAEADDQPDGFVGVALRSAWRCAGGRSARGADEVCYNRSR
jgi:hypothetical protein